MAFSNSITQTRASQVPFDAFKHVLVKFSDVTNTTDQIEGFGIIEKSIWETHATAIAAKVDPIDYVFGALDAVTISFDDGADALTKFTVTELTAPEIEAVQRLFSDTREATSALFYSFGHFPLQVLIDAEDA